MAELQKVKQITIGGKTYEIGVNGNNISGDIAWDNLSAAVGSSIAGVYRVKGSTTFETLPTSGSVGDVWNLTTSGVIDGQYVYAGDNVVYTDAGWDKLAASVSLDGYATTGYVDTATAAATATVWTETTGYLDTMNHSAVSTLWGEITAAIEAAQPQSADLWNQTYETVEANGELWNASYEVVTAQSGVWNDAADAIDNALTTSAQMTVSANNSSLVQNGAITGYIDAKIAETISETIDIASSIDETTPTSAIPNVGALTGYVDEKIGGLTGDYVEKRDIYFDGNQTLVFDI